MIYLANYFKLEPLAHMKISIGDFCGDEL